MAARSLHRLRQAHHHPELSDRTVWEVFEAERPMLVPIAGLFDGFQATQAAVSKTCLVRFDNNKYSVAARAVGRPVEIQAYVDRLVIRQDGVIVGEHPRRFGRGEMIYDPWHYVPVLARKPGALMVPFHSHWPIECHDTGTMAIPSPMCHRDAGTGESCLTPLSRQPRPPGSRSRPSLERSSAAIC